MIGSRTGTEDIETIPIDRLVEYWNDGLLNRAEMQSYLHKHPREVVDSLSIPDDLKEGAQRIREAIERGEDVFFIMGGC